MINREELNEIWNSLHYTENIDSEIESIAPGLTELLVSSLIQNGDFEVGLFDDKDYSGSCIAFDIYNSDKILSLRYKQDDTYELHLALENGNFEMVDFYHLLKENEINIIPEGLRDLMKQVCVTGEAMTYQKNNVE